MIRPTAGDLPDHATDRQAIIDTVNTVGVMDKVDKGIARQFANAYAKNHDADHICCRRAFRCANGHVIPPLW